MTRNTLRQVSGLRSHDSTHPLAVAPAHEQFRYARVIGNGTLRARGVHHGKRNQNRPRPRGHVVDIEVEPLGHQHGFRRNGRNAAPVVLPEHGEVEFGEGIALRHAALFENGVAGAAHKRLVLLMPGQFAGEIGFHGRADIRRAAGIDRPVAFRMLLAANVFGEFAKFLRIAAIQKLQEQNILAFEDGIAFQFGDPVALRLLPIQQIVLRARNGVANGFQRDGFRRQSMGDSHIAGN